jgi:hypothetical protein
MVGSPPRQDAVFREEIESCNVSAGESLLPAEGIDFSLGL